jgi:hypothetical protein
MSFQRVDAYDIIVGPPVDFIRNIQKFPVYINAVKVSKEGLKG